MSHDMIMRPLGARRVAGTDAMIMAHEVPLPHRRQGRLDFGDAVWRHAVTGMKGKFFHFSPVKKVEDVLFLFLLR